jgi:uncharacterized alkaline shock family protein YloU
MANTDQTTTEQGHITTEHGKTTIDPVVVAKIAARAAREITGVHDLVPTGFGATVAGLAEQVSGSSATGTQGVTVNVGQDQATVNVTMTVDYGVSIPQVADGVRNNVMNRVQSMTGLTVTDVNIEVTDLYFQQAAAAQRSQSAQSAGA